MFLRHKRKLRIACMGLILLIALSVVVPGVSAAQPYPGYTYNSDGEAVPTALPYEPTAVFSGADMGVGKFSKPSDLYVAQNGEIYLLDAGNHRIVVMNPDITFNRVILPQNENGEQVEFQEAVGLSVCRDGRILICDKKGQAVYVLDQAGKQLQKIVQPNSVAIPDNFQFQPLKAEEDSGGILYVLSSGSYSGAMQFEPDGTFIGFYGSEEVDVTLDVLLNHFWKNLLSKEAAEGLSRTVPVEFVSFCIDRKDFIFTIRKGNGVKTGQVRKLNAKGANVLAEDKTFGDHIEDIQLTDIVVDDEGFVTVLDGSSGRILQYDGDGEMLYAFGGKGSQAGSFNAPVALESVGDQLLVLDKDIGLLTVFTPTAFAADVRTATNLYRDGKYSDALLPWKRVLTQDNQYEPANIGMGKIYEGLGEYDAAMEFYRRGNAPARYSDAFEQYRDGFLRKHFALCMLVIVALALTVMVRMSGKPAAREVYTGGRPRGKYPGYCMIHPLDGYSDLKAEKSGSVWLANCILAAFFAVSVLAHQFTGFTFNPNRVDELNLFAQLCSTAGIFAAFVLCNWAVTTIMDGKGKLSEIWTFCAYALLPYVVLESVLIVLSNVLTGDEYVFYAAVQAAAYIWTSIAMLIALREVHQYSLKKTLGTLAATFLD